MKSNSNPGRGPLKLGIFFSHPTQHHSILFRELSRVPGLDVQIHYYDPGAVGGMFDPGYGNANPWDVDLLAGTRHRILRNLLRRSRSGADASRQLNPQVVPILIAEKFDYVLIYGYVSISNWLVLFTAKALGAKVLYQSDTNDVDEKGKKRFALVTAMMKYFLRQVDVFLTIGDHNRQAYLDFGCNPDKMKWSPYPVDVARYRQAVEDPERQPKLEALRRSLDIPNEARVVVFCGKLIARKRPDDVVAAVLSIDRPDVYALLIGSGEEEERLRQHLPAGAPIRITGFVNQSMIPYHMLLGDVGVVASDRDPHPLVTTEFAACGLPVLVSDRTGVWGPNDILRHGENGFVYRCGDTAQLAGFIKRVLDDRSLQACMSRRSRELADTQAAPLAAANLAEWLLAGGILELQPS
jgi:glycosyltransferase involved in cell wall biosynthesis